MLILIVYLNLFEFSLHVDGPRDKRELKGFQTQYSINSVAQFLNMLAWQEKQIFLGFQLILHKEDRPCW